MRPAIPLLLALALSFAPSHAARAACDTSGLADGTQVAELTTSLGTICFELLAADAPGHVENFLYYLQNGLLADTFFHRSVAGFVLQGGTFQMDANLVPVGVTSRPVVVTNEPCTLDTPASGQSGVMICSQRGNVRGSVALAKAAGDPDSGSSSWFINLADNRAGSAQLDSQDGGFTVFARVFQGMDVVDAIAALTLATRDDLAWVGSTQALVPASSFVFTSPLRSPPLYGVFGQYGCFDPLRQVTILDPTKFPTLSGVADPILPNLIYHTLSEPCGTPTTQGSFVADPGPPGCTDVDRIGVKTTGPVSLGVTTTYTEFSCAQAADALAQRELWRAAFKSHFASQLVYIEAATTKTVPEPGAALGAGVALASLARLHRRARRSEATRRGLRPMAQGVTEVHQRSRSRLSRRPS